MKALEILKVIGKENLFQEFMNKNKGNLTIFINEAIEEIKLLQRQNKLLDTHSKRKDDMLDIYENKFKELENRSCENCKHYKQSSMQIYKTCYINKVNGFNLESDIDFYCNKWEKKQ